MTDFPLGIFPKKKTKKNSLSTCESIREEIFSLPKVLRFKLFSISSCSWCEEVKSQKLQKLLPFSDLNSWGWKSDSLFFIQMIITLTWTHWHIVRCMLISRQTMMYSYARRINTTAADEDSSHVKSFCLSLKNGN